MGASSDFRSSAPRDTRCMSGSSPTACEDGHALATSYSNPAHEIEQTRKGSTETQASSRKRTPCPMEEADLLLKLRKDECRPWSEVARLFSEQYPGRSLGAIQVYWSTTSHVTGTLNFDAGVGTWRRCKRVPSMGTCR